MLDSNRDVPYEVFGVLSWKKATYWHLNQICTLFWPPFFIMVDIYNNIMALFGFIIFSYILYCYCSKRYRSSHLAPDQQLIIALSLGVLISSCVAFVSGRILAICARFDYSQAYVTFIGAVTANIRVYYCDSMYYFLLLLLAIYRYSFTKSSSYCYYLFSEWKSLRYLAAFLLFGTLFVTVTQTLEWHDNKMSAEVRLTLYCLYMAMWHLFYLTTLGLIVCYYSITTKNIMKGVVRNKYGAVGHKYTISTSTNDEMDHSLLNAFTPTTSEQMQKRDRQYAKHLKNFINVAAPILILNYVCWAVCSLDQVLFQLSKMGVIQVSQEVYCPLNSSIFGLIVDICMILSYVLAEAVDTLLKVYILLLMRTNEQFKVNITLPLRDIRRFFC